MRTGISAIDLQELLFQSEVSRRELTELDVAQFKDLSPLNITILRNHSFELIAKQLTPFLAYSNFEAAYTFSDYDDSLSFLNVDQDTNLVILWIDLARYQAESLDEFLKIRLGDLRKKFNAPLLVLTIQGPANFPYAELGIYSVEQILGNKQKIIDGRLQAIAGSPLSFPAQAKLAKKLGLEIIPSLLIQRTKCIVLDLDNTLYEGVLAEDGPRAVNLSEGHIALQEHLLELANKGVLLCVASKNDYNDVTELFEQRNDFPLKLENFLHIGASWEPKSKTISSIEDLTNTTSDSYIFIDDNIAELFEVQTQHQQIRPILAKPQAHQTLEILRAQPGLQTKSAGIFEASIRKEDILANSARLSKQQELTFEEYLKSLDVTLTFEINPMDKVARITELASKTNQFIFTYLRPSLQQVTESISNSDKLIVTVDVQDSLSQSGTVAALFMTIENEVLKLDELVMSCRALGRGLEEEIVLEAIKFAQESSSCQNIEIDFVTGPRNVPAKNFYNEHLAGITSQYVGNRAKSPNIIHVYKNWRHHELPR